MDWLQVLAVCISIVVGFLLTGVVVVFLVKFLIELFVVRAKTKAINFASKQGKKLATTASKKAVSLVKEHAAPLKDKAQDYIKQKSSQAIKSSINFAVNEASSHLKTRLTSTKQDTQPVLDLAPTVGESQKC